MGGGPEDFTNFRLERGLADQDVRNRFVFSSVYELPFGKGRKYANNMNRAADLLAGGWQLNGILLIQEWITLQLNHARRPTADRIWWATSQQTLATPSNTSISPWPVAEVPTVNGVLHSSCRRPTF